MTNAIFMLKSPIAWNCRAEETLSNHAIAILHEFKSCPSYWQRSGVFATPRRDSPAEEHGTCGETETTCSRRSPKIRCRFSRVEH